MPGSILDASAPRRRRFLALVVGGALAVAMAAPTQAGAPASVRPDTTTVHHDTAKMSSWDEGGTQYQLGTVTLDTYSNSRHVWTKETLRFKMHDLFESTLYRARIIQGSCDDPYSQKTRVSFPIRTDASGRLTGSVTLTAQQLATMRSLSRQYPAVSIYLFVPATGASAPCGQLWPVG